MKPVPSSRNGWTGGKSLGNVVGRRFATISEIRKRVRFFRPSGPGKRVAVPTWASALSFKRSSLSPLSFLEIGTKLTLRYLTVRPAKSCVKRYKASDTYISEYTFPFKRPQRNFRITLISLTFDLSYVVVVSNSASLNNQITKLT